MNLFRIGLVLTTLAFSSSWAQSPNTDDSIPFSKAQNQNAARVFVSDQVQVLTDVFELAKRLEEKKESIVLGLGRARIEDLKNALAMPEGNFVSNNRKEARLEKLDYDAYKGLDWTSEQSLSDIGYDIYNKRSIKGERIAEFEVIVPGLGRAEPTNDNGIVYPRIVHERSGICFFIVPKALDLNSKEVKVHRARVQSLSDKGEGRPQVYLATEDRDVQFPEEGHPLRYQFIPKPVGMKEKFNSWWKAVYSVPDKSAAAIAGMSLLYQVGTSEGVSAKQYFFNGAPTWEHIPTYLTIGYATVFGLYASFYNNVCMPADPMNKMSRLKKMALRTFISTATFTYSLQILSHGLHSISLYTYGGWLQNVALIANIAAANAIKDEWKKMSDLDDINGTSRGTTKLFGVDVKRSQYNRTLIGQIPGTLRYLDVVGLSIMAYGHHIPIGSYLFYSSFIWSQYLLVRLAENKGYPEAVQLRNNWNHLIDTPARLFRYSLDSYRDLVLSPTQFFQQGIQGFSDMRDAFSSFCNRLMGGEGAPKKQLMKAPFEVSADGQWMTITP